LFLQSIFLLLILIILGEAYKFLWHFFFQSCCYFNPLYVHVLTTAPGCQAPSVDIPFTPGAFKE
jgi:hypothetical protein